MSHQNISLIVEKLGKKPEMMAYPLADRLLQQVLLVRSLKVYGLVLFAPWESFHYFFKVVCILHKFVFFNRSYRQTDLMSPADWDFNYLNILLEQLISVLYLKVVIVIVSLDVMAAK